jgi:PTS system mannose-specific IIA component
LTWRERENKTTAPGEWKKSMIGVLIVTHGDLAGELLKTTHFIVGDVPNMSSFSIDPKESAAEIRGRLEQAIIAANQGDGVLILTDMFGGTPANMALSLLEQQQIEVITGINLPMLIKLGTSRNDGKSLMETARFVANYGQRNISVASDLLKSRRAKEGAGGT